MSAAGPDRSAHIWRRRRYCRRPWSRSAPASRAARRSNVAGCQPVGVGVEAAIAGTEVVDHGRRDLTAIATRTNQRRTSRPCPPRLLGTIRRRAQSPVESLVASRSGAATIAPESSESGRRESRWARRIHSEPQRIDMASSHAIGYRRAALAAKGIVDQPDKAGHLAGRRLASGRWIDSLCVRPCE